MKTQIILLVVLIGSLLMETGCSIKKATHYEPIEEVEK